MDKKRDKKQFYKAKFQDSKRHEEIKNGMTGFLVTCDGKDEKRCVKEIFNLLNDFVERVYPDLDESPLKQSESASKRQKVSGDSLEQEVAELKHGKKLWYTFDMQLPGVIFIKLIDCMRSQVSCQKLMQAILDEIVNNKQALTRFAFRMLPIFCLHKANLEDFKDKCSDEISKTFQPKPLQWCFEFKARNNAKCQRQDFY